VWCYDKLDWFSEIYIIGGHIENLVDFVFLSEKMALHVLLPEAFIFFLKKRPRLTDWNKAGREAENSRLFFLFT
jgi:hypothetical protein